MGERKVLNKYYPSDFDPARIQKRRRQQRMRVRTMLPMSIRCRHCGVFIGRGTKFNSLKEEVVGENYLMIKLFRLCIKCPECAAEIITKTDPQDSDYAVEWGAVRNFEPWREEAEGEATGKSLEDKALESKRYMEINAGLEEMKSMKSRRATGTVHDMLAALKRRSGWEKEKIQDEEAIHFVRRIQDDDDEDEDFRRDLCLIKEL